MILVLTSIRIPYILGGVSIHVRQKLMLPRALQREKRTFFCINTVHGKDVTKFSANQDEDEVVLMPGTCLRVQSTSSGINGLYLVHLNEW